MRTVFLRPGHSSWWLLSPGITLFFDRVEMLRSDFDQVLTQEGVSSYHYAISRNLMRLLKDGCLELRLVEDSDELQSDVDPVELAGNLIEVARNPNDPSLNCRDIVSLTVDAYRYWIAYNERKAKFLVPDERLRQDLEQEMLPEWRARMNSLRLLLEENDDQVTIEKFLSDKHAKRTFVQMVGASDECIRLVDAGKHVHDPMLPEYIPMISVLEHLRSVPVGHVVPTPMLLFDAYQWRMSRFGSLEPVPRQNRIGRFLAEK